jgi:MoxR-like ATPase
MTQDTLLTPDELVGYRNSAQKIIDGLNQVLLGKEETVETTVICLLARGHLLLEGLPGLGKTELVKGLSRLLGLEFSRIQFTPDLLPSDITGSHILETSADGTRNFTFRKGPVFANLVLADEINRASPKTQAALLEAMQEHRVTLLGTTHTLPAPFFVLATQNPIELEGTYPLPEAQLDRFMFKVDVTGVDAATMTAILTSRIRGQAPALEPVLSEEELNRLFDTVDQVFLPQAVAEYISRLVTATNPENPESPDLVKQFVRYGVSPRAGIGLASAGRAAALLAGKPNVGFDDIKRVALPVLRHRLLLSYQANLEGVSAPAVVDQLLTSIHELDRVPKEIAQ